jgi:hypothetical protein
MIFMPDPVREAVHFMSCKHISSSLVGVLLGPNVKKFNCVAMVNMDQDLRRLETFAEKARIANLRESFAEIRQLINLFLNGDNAINDYADEQKRAAIFPALSVSKVLKLLDKYKEPGILASTPKGINVIKRKTVDNAITKLKKWEEQSNKK